jgi:serine/threonine kinase PknH
MGLFVSYSSQDRSAIEPLTAALRRARQQVWFDDDLGGGEAWWNEILEQIRSCEVFIIALSNHSLESKPCQAELRYAKALERPILPVQIGPVDSMRANPVAALQVIDYQNPSADTAIQLVTAVHGLAAQQRPLPSPLPDGPPVPFAYLMRLSTTLAEQDLDPRQQTHLVTELKAGLEEDGDDPTARNDIARLLRMLRDRSDVTYRTRTEIDELLASVESKPRAADASAEPARPQHERPVARAIAAPPPKANPRKQWLIAGAVGLTVVVASVAAVLFLTQKPSTTKPSTTPSSAPTALPPTDLGAILLSPADLNTIMDATNLQVATQTSQMVTSPGMPTNTACHGAFEPIQAAAYQGSGYTAVQSLGLKAIDPPKRVFAGAVEFPSADGAQAFLKTSADSWHACAGQTVAVADGAQTTPWTFGELKGQPPRIVQRRTHAIAGGRECQHVLRAVSRVVIDVIACGNSITNQASVVADQMAAKVTP